MSVLVEHLVVFANFDQLQILPRDQNWLKSYLLDKNFYQVDHSIMKTKKAVNKSSISKSHSMKCQPISNVSKRDRIKISLPRNLSTEPENTYIQIPMRNFRCGYCRYRAFHLLGLVGHMKVHKIKQPNMPWEEVISLKHDAVKSIRKAAKNKRASGNFMVTKLKDSRRRNSL